MITLSDLQPTDLLCVLSLLHLNIVLELPVTLFQLSEFLLQLRDLQTHTTYSKYYSVNHCVQRKHIRCDYSAMNAKMKEMFKKI